MTTTAEPGTTEEPVTIEGDWHADDCDGTCFRWAGTGTPSCLPQGCGCEAYKTAREWGGDRCWYKRKVNGIYVGGVTSRCPCWGDSKDGKPGNCCSHHSANPRYLWDPAAGTPTAPEVEAPQDDEDPAGSDDASTPDEGSTRPDLDQLDWRYIDDPWIDPERQLPPFIRRWEPAELTCTCPTPWDTPPGKKVDIRTLGVHCTNCHQNFRSPSVAHSHRKSWAEPCRHPSTMLDVDTGHPVMELHGDVWTGTTTSSYRPAGWTPGRFIATAAPVPAEAFSWD